MIFKDLKGEYLMRLAIFFMISCSLINAMEQPSQVAQLENYTLISNDGKEVILDGNLVRNYASGLAEQFRSGFKEAQGKLAVLHFDGQTLQNFKMLLEQTAKKEVELQRYNEIVSSGVNAEIELAPGRMYVGQGTKEQQISNYQMQELVKGMYRVRAKVYEYAAQLKDEIEKLPEIGEHFLALFNEIVKWRVPYILELALGQFAAENIDIKDGFQKLKGLDPRAQLFYLHEVDFTVESIEDLYKWVVELSNTPAQTIQSNKDLYDDIVEKLIEFSAQNIQSILAKHPNFKSLFEMIAFNLMGELLRKEFLKEKYNNLFMTILRTAKRWGPHSTILPYVSSLGGTFIALHDKDQSNNIYDWQNKVFKSSSQLGSQSNTQYVLWGADRLVGHLATNIYVYDINTGKRIFYTQLNIGENIKEIVPITSNQLFIVGTMHKVYKFTLKEKNTYSIEKLLDRTLGVSAINNQEFVAVEYTGNLLKRLTLRNSNNRILKELPIPDADTYMFLSTLRKISNEKIEILLYRVSRAGFYDLKYIIVSIPDLQLISVSDFEIEYIPTYYYGFLPITTNYILVKEIHSSFSNLMPENANIYLYDVISKIKFPLERISSAVVLDKNQIIGFDKITNNFVTQFIPYTSTLSEILDEIQRKTVPPSPQSLIFIPQKPQLQKRPVSPVPEVTIPAAAKGLKPEAHEAKRPREEKSDK